MDVAALLLELYGRIPPLAAEAVDGLDADDLCWSPDPEANPIGWLVWHATRVQDHHLSELMGSDQVWVSGDRAGSFGLAPEPDDVGYGHTPEQVHLVRPRGPEALLAYHGAVDARTRDFLADLSATDLDAIVDTRWDPPVTLGVRLVSVADDSLQHMGQAAYLRGLLDRFRADRG
jgi:hypothetical protein